MMLNKPLLGLSPVVPLAGMLLGGSLLSGCTVNSSSHLAQSGNAAPSQAAFEAPIKLQADGADIQLPAPGWAYPVMHDVTGDGRDDLIVGQYKDGKMGVYAQKSDGSFTWHDWLQAGGDDAVVPGIW